MGFFRDPNFRDFLFWARSKNRENPEIPGIGIGILKPLKNPEKIPSANFLKSRYPGGCDRDFKSSKKSRVQNLENPGDRDFNSRFQNDFINFHERHFP